MLSRPLSFRAGELEAPLQARTDIEGDAAALSRTAARDLERYYALITATLARWSFSEAEASLIVDALNGTFTEPHTAHLLWAEVDDAIRMDGLAEKWGVDADSLIYNLRRATPFEALAISDAAERFWVSVARDGDMPHADRLQKVGLFRPSTQVTGYVPADEPRADEM